MTSGDEEKWRYVTWEELQDVTIRVAFIKCRETIIEQYTGLKDKMGKKIFVGDLCRWVDSRKNILLGKIIFKSGMFSFERSKGFTYQLSICTALSPHTTPCEIIGNIHESKDS